MAGAQDSTYTRDLYTATLTSGRSNTVLYPCTFGGMENNVALPATAKRNPSVGVGNPENWADATSAVDYIQYSVTLRAQQYNPSTEQVEPLQNINIYLSDIMLEDADTTAGDLTTALRMHIHTNDGTTDKYFLIGSAATTLDTYGHLDVDGDGIKDLILYLSDISATDASRGAEVRMLLRDESYSALVASTTQEPDSVEDVAATQKPATVIVRGVQPTQFTLNISFRGPCLLRYQSDGVTDENYYQSGDVLNITATRGNPIRLWISNHNALKIQVVADARTYDLDLGRAGEVMVEEIRWLRDSSGSRLVVLELD
jgi:hypothetical protein